MKNDEGHSKCHIVLQRPKSWPRHLSIHASDTPLLGCPTQRRKLPGLRQASAGSCGNPAAWLALSTRAPSSLHCSSTSLLSLSSSSLKLLCGGFVPPLANCLTLSAPALFAKLFLAGDTRNVDCSKELKRIKRIVFKKK